MLGYVSDGSAFAFTFLELRVKATICLEVAEVLYLDFAKVSWPKARDGEDLRKLSAAVGGRVGGTTLSNSEWAAVGSIVLPPSVVAFKAREYLKNIYKFNRALYVSVCRDGLVLEQLLIQASDHS